MFRLGTIILLIILILPCCSSTSRETIIIESFVFDNEHILTEAEEQKFDKLFRQHEQKTTNEIVLVTTPDFGIDGDILLFSVNFAETKGIGKKDKNNGVVIVFSKAKRETRISTGYGAEKVLKDEIAKKIIDSLMIPQFKNGKYADGLYSGSKAITTFLERPENKIN